MGQVISQEVARKALKVITGGAGVQTPEFLDWIADLLVHGHGGHPYIDYVQTLRNRANDMRKVLALVKEEEKVMKEGAEIPRELARRAIEECKRFRDSLIDRDVDTASMSRNITRIADEHDALVQPTKPAYPAEAAARQICQRMRDLRGKVSLVGYIDGGLATEIESIIKSKYKLREEAIESTIAHIEHHRQDIMDGRRSKAFFMDCCAEDYARLRLALGLD